jgi:predicted enzyme related to lactoylglutathione lyase
MVPRARASKAKHANREIRDRSAHQQEAIMAHHPVVHFEIGCHDGGATREFFAKLFDWEITSPSEGLMISTGAPDDVTGHIVELAGEWGNYVTVYVQVEDLDAYLAKAIKLGGKTLVKPVTLPGRGSFAWLASPEGNVLGLWKPA